MFKKPLLWLIVMSLLLLEGGCIALRRSDMKAGITDFSALYGAARSVRLGSSPDYDPSTIQGVDRIQGHETKPISLNLVDRLHPPFEALLFLPLTWLSYPNAYFVWSACNLVLVWLVPLVLWRFIPRMHAEFEVIAFVYGLMLPVIVCLLEGQDSVLLLFLLSLSFASLEEGRDLRAGIFLALGLFKFHLVLPLVAALIVARKWRAISGFFTGFLAMLLVTFAVVGTRETLGYVPFVLRFSQHISSNASEKTAMMPNVRGLVSFLATPLATARVQSMVVVCVSAVLLLLMLGWSFRFRQVSSAIQFSFVIAVTSLISYHYYVHNAVILVIPLLLMANEFAAPGADPILRRVFAVASISICLTLMVASLGVLLLETAMPIVAIETIILAGVLFALPFRQRSGTPQAA